MTIQDQIQNRQRIIDEFNRPAEPRAGGHDSKQTRLLLETKRAGLS